jgi:hypothetical protein
MIKKLICILFHKKYHTCIQQAYEACDDCICYKCGRKWIK